MLSKSKKLVVSLFCGVGGLDLGFQSAGFEVAVAIDNNPKVLELYRINFPNTLILCRDIGDISAVEIREIIQNKYPDWDGEIALIIGGPPCQGFSVAGKQDVNDARSQLVIKFINLVVELNPLMFVMENVPAIESKKFESITGNAIALIEEHYILSKWLLTASHYGVPQKRQRAIWVGSKFGEIDAPYQSNRRFSVGDAISDLSHIPINPQTDTWEWNSQWREKGEYAQYLEKIFPNSSSSQKDIITGCKATVHTVATQQKYADTKPGKKEPTTWAYRLSKNGFSPTLRAGSGNRTSSRPIHYEQARVITVREAARLHSFPDWFDFGTSKLAAHKAIGNSVPPLLAYAIAQTLSVELEQKLPCRKSALKTLSASSFFGLTHAPNFAYTKTVSFLIPSVRVEEAIKKCSGTKYLLREIIFVDDS
ncbi:DNA cytosine methyltransferase [Plectonema cf. radiosum LEGE 06105]|uniref:DNA (cytosine-5-)-methyltransferase n=1 Tax=Plectonema cf. radiosum LEGE 06105 TaxID=945769 RepID=A0A8J7F1L5_9CYAN|nr:DNA cytosine methyltransferase [Plectonema radiosum]MBE9213152.1 DNA cytosine methyltransferase [Plectonema cf. radiosum LEGE 06105]